MKRSNLFFAIAIFTVIALIFGCASGNEATAPVVQPVQVQPVVSAASCSDGILNQDETKIDCGGKCSPCAVPVETPPPTPTPTPPKTEEISYSISEDKLAQLKTKLTPTTKSVIYPNAYLSGLSVGDSYVFPYGVTNTFTNNKPSDFKYEVQFLRAIDSSNNAIQGIDSKTILLWFSNNKFEVHTLANYQQVFFPVGVTVGKEIGPGVKTAPGKYTFALVSFYTDSNIYRKYDAPEFTLSVK
jgi:hypothetical protein